MLTEAILTPREKRLLELQLQIQLSRIDEHIRHHEQNIPPFLDEPWWQMREFLQKARVNVIHTMGEVEKIGVSRLTWWDRLVIWVAEWAMRDRIKLGE